jgi:predicted amidohydrolase
MVSSSVSRPRSPLTVALAQPSLVAGDVKANAAAHVEAIRAAGSRLVVFPELSMTSYVLSAPAVALDDPVWAPIVEACAATASVALVGAPVADTDGRAYITTVAVDAGGPATVYRKINVHGDEHDHFAPGERPAAFAIDGWRLGLAICRDTSVDAHIADTAALGIDAYVGATLDSPSRAAARDERTAALAAEYGIWVAMSCFAGDAADFGQGAGGSAVWNPHGSLVAQAGDRPGPIVTATLS